MWSSNTLHSPLSASINIAQFLFSAFRVNSLGFWLWYCAGSGNRPRKYLSIASVLPHHGALQVASLASSLNFYLYPNMYSFKNQKSMYLMNWSGIQAAKCQTDSIGWETTICYHVQCRWSHLHVDIRMFPCPGLDTCTSWSLSASARQYVEL